MRKLTHMLLAGTLILACSSCGVETTANYQVSRSMRKDTNKNQLYYIKMEIES